MENHKYYSDRIQDCNKKYNEANRKYRFLGSARLISFGLIALGVYIFWGNLILIFPFVLFFSLFLFLVHLSVDAKYKRDKLKKIIELNHEELNVLSGNWLHFKEGNEYKDPKHAFALDMDLFGKKSIYQLLNRTVSRKGSDRLAFQLQQGISNTQLTNKAIEEFSKQMDWCQEFLAEGMVFNSEDLEREFHRINKIEYKEPFLGKILRIAIPIGSFTATTLFALDVISGAVFGTYLAIVLSLVGKNFKKANSISAQVTAYASQVKMFIRQLEHYKSLSLQTSELEHNRNTLFEAEHNLMESLLQLEKIQQRMDYRMNLLVGFVLNFFFAWDYYVLFQWENWRNRNKGFLTDWENQLAQIEVWISGATYKFNFPESTFANFVETERIHIAELGHPFVPASKRIVNDVELNSEEHFIIITGPNMAGKSTYLRSLGLAFICANAGFPILAKSCEIPKMKLYSSMRTTDDLTVESSYFHAELTRLRFIMDAIEKGDKVFVILDEILKGTNSKDKEIGSAKFLEKLQRLNAKGVIATHDLSLCKLAEGNSAFKNMYFDSTIEGNELSFDYKIRSGICQNMNASFLLKKMKLVD